MILVLMFIFHFPPFFVNFTQVYCVKFYNIGKDGDHMREVGPIRDRKKIKAIKILMEKRGAYRDLLLFVLGINTGLRVSDLLSMKWSLFLDRFGSIKKVNSRITIKEQKTGKTKMFIMNKSIHHAVERYLRTLKNVSKDDYIFASRSRKNGHPRSITRQYVWLLLNKYAKIVGIRESIGTHTLRKTFGYQLYKKGVSVEYIQKMLNHSSSSTTLRYIGITQEELDEIYIDLNL